MLFTRGQWFQHTPEPSPNLPALLVGLPVNINTASMDELAALPDVSNNDAQAIVSDRDQRGLFYERSDLRRVNGLGAVAYAAVEALVTVGQPGERPRIDLNEATARQLDWLPGIGPVRAAEIVRDREENGPFTSLADLKRVHGVGPATVDKLSPWAEVP
jgi:competence protein ComEA